MLEKCIELPKFIGDNLFLEKYLEGFDMNGNFNPSEAYIHTLFAKGPLYNKEETFPLLHRPSKLDLAFITEDNFSAKIHFTVIGNNKNEKFQTIPIIINLNEFEKINEIIQNEISKNRKEGYEYPKNLNIIINNVKRKNVNIIEIENVTEIEDINDLFNIYCVKIEVFGKFIPFKNYKKNLSFKYKSRCYAKSRYSSYNYSEEEGKIVTTRIPTYIETKYKPHEINFDVTYSKLSKIEKNELDFLLNEINLKNNKKIDELKELAQKTIEKNNLSKERIERELENDIKRLENEKKDLENGVLNLKNNNELLESFKILNLAFLKRHEHAEKMGKKYKNEKWRLFQLTYIISEIGKIFQNEKTLTMINFPTGMGKTEAFMSVAILKIIYERITKNNHGTSVIIKYPRKILSRQQVSRALELISYANMALFEKNDIIQHPISVGTLFNKDDTPNRLINTYQKAVEISESFNKWIEDPKNRAIRLSHCPICGSEIEAKGIKEDLRIKFKCTGNTNQKCLYREKTLNDIFERNLGEIPIYISDDEVFRYLPSILITTIDKFASFCAVNQNIKTLLLHEDIKCNKKYGFYYSNKEFDKFEECYSENIEIDYEIFKKPSLFIFDEIHLVTGSYASKLSILESAFMDLFDIDKNNPPHIICSSATLNKGFNGTHYMYQEDYSKIFLKNEPEKINLYPTFWDMFIIKKKEPIRIIKMIMPSLYSNLNVTLKISKLYSELEKEHFKDKWKEYSTILYYFNSKSKLERMRGQIHRYIEKDIKKDIELSADLKEEEIAKNQSYLEKKLDEENPKRDFVYSTSIIANGIDNDAFNIIFIFGMPHMISEYIQARSRISRKDVTGLCIVFLPHIVRDTSAFMNFREIHENIDLAIENCSTNRDSEGVINNMIKKLFHLSLQYRYDSVEKPFYRTKIIKEILNDNEKVSNIKKDVERWLDVNDNQKTLKFFQDSWNEYINEYKTYVDGAIQRKAYVIYSEKVTNYVIPQPSLIDISEPITIRLNNNDIFIAEKLKNIEKINHKEITVDEDDIYDG